jgi:hypothetical protein
MADASATPPDAPVTEEAFLASRMSFWHFFTGMTTKMTVGLIYFCGWLWWCSFAGFSLLHVLALPVVVALIFVFL